MKQKDLKNNLLFLKHFFKISVYLIVFLNICLVFFYIVLNINVWNIALGFVIGAVSSLGNIYALSKSLFLLLGSNSPSVFDMTYAIIGFLVLCLLIITIALFFNNLLLGVVIGLITPFCICSISFIKFKVK